MRGGRGGEGFTFRVCVSSSSSSSSLEKKKRTQRGRNAETALSLSLSIFQAIGRDGGRKGGREEGKGTHRTFSLSLSLFLSHYLSRTCKRRGPSVPSCAIGYFHALTYKSKSGWERGAREGEREREYIQSNARCDGSERPDHLYASRHTSHLRPRGGGGEGRGL